MGTKDEEFLKRLLATFKVEAAEHLKAISAGLLQLEKEPSPEKQADTHPSHLSGSPQP